MSNVVPFRRPEIDPAELQLEIMRALQCTGMWRRLFYPSDADGITAARSAGRRAGRALGVKIITKARDAGLRDDGQVSVIVFAEELAPEPDMRAVTKQLDILFRRF